MSDRRFFLTLHAIQRQLAGMPNNFHFIRLIHRLTRRPAPENGCGPRVISYAEEWYSAARTQRWGCNVYVLLYAGYCNAGYSFLDLDQAKPRVLEAMCANGHEPCVVRETSRGYLQAWVRVSTGCLEPLSVKRHPPSRCRNLTSPLDEQRLVQSLIGGEMTKLILPTRRRCSLLTTCAGKLSKLVSLWRTFRAAGILCIALSTSLFAGFARAQTWNLVWSDEFNGPAGPFTPTSSNNQWWTFDTGHGIFGTGEIEYMIDDGTTSYLDGAGHLVIETYQTGSNYYSARFKTQLNGSFGFDFQYGRVEASIQIPTSQGIWPAFWMMGDNGVSWPGRGEIDIMENRGSEPNRVLGTIHGIGYASTGLGAHFTSDTPFYQDFHTYGMIWSPYLIQFYVDDPTNIYASYTPGEIMGVGTNPSTGASTTGEWDFWGHAFYILFDVAVGGGFPGPPGPDTVLPQYMTIDYVRVYQADPPNGPTRLSATAVSNSQVQLSWTASTTSDPNLTYNVFRSTTPGTAHNISNTDMSQMISTGVTGTTFTDVMLSPGTTYYYQVSATGQESGESDLSNETNVTLPPTGTQIQPIAISAGGLVGSDAFVQDTGYNIGATNAYPDVIDVSGVTDPAPQGVYRTERWGPTTYTIPNLTPGGSYTVRLHFAETAFQGVGQRHFNVTINGALVLNNYDIYADAGTMFKATEKVFAVTADDNGTLTIDLTAGTGAPHINPSIRGIEVLPTSGDC